MISSRFLSWSTSFCGHDFNIVNKKVQQCARCLGSIFEGMHSLNSLMLWLTRFFQNKILENCWYFYIVIALNDRVKPSKSKKVFPDHMRYVVKGPIFVKWCQWLTFSVNCQVVTVWSSAVSSQDEWCSLKWPLVSVSCQVVNGHLYVVSRQQYCNGH
jgi:hypothetical protein